MRQRGWIRVRKRIVGIFLVSIMLLFVLAGCGTKSQKDVVTDLGNKLDKMEGYKTNALLTFKQGKKNQTYQAEIWFKKPSYYRVVLSDMKKQNTQMILRNKEGVYVLTPQLNKTYKFDSNWPNNRSQAYLFQSLANDIMNDADSTFTSKNNQYIFKTKTSYQTKELANQQITLKKDLTPTSVKVMDKDMNVVVDVTFKNFQVDPKLSTSDFNVKENMTTSSLEKSQSTSGKVASSTSFEVAYPTIKLEGTKMKEMKSVTTGGSKKFILRYSGKKPYTLIESQSQVMSTSSPVQVSGEPVNMGSGVATLGENSLTWSHGGTDYYLVSDKLTDQEMQDVARSVAGKVEK